ncbi:MAG: hypothetical protein ACK5MU_04330 [Candidatus Saccharimonadales bacterium]
MSKNKLLLITTGGILSLASVFALTQPTSAYITGCDAPKRINDGYYSLKCKTSGGANSNDGFQAYAMCVNFLGIGSTVYGNKVVSGGTSYVQCGFGTSVKDGRIYYKSATL